MFLCFKKYLRWRKVGDICVALVGKTSESWATGATAEDNSLFELYLGIRVLPKGMSLVGDGLNTIKAPVFRGIGEGIKTYAPRLGANRYLRIGLSHSRGREVFKVTWGNNSKHLLDIDLGIIPRIRR